MAKPPFDDYDSDTHSEGEHLPEPATTDKDVFELIFENEGEKGEEKTKKTSKRSDGRKHQEENGLDTRPDSFEFITRSIPEFFDDP